jgi:ubiquitin-protein ligase E3 B
MSHDKKSFTCEAEQALILDSPKSFSYMHLVAQFRMHTQIKDQIAAFTRGFRAIVNPVI